ncbi:MAG: PDGLE domain-containing protein [Candidatus Subteraquimicrobiales bacterium]|nr:PDGLE domain-containing protein [Candidatus Subteraquimicrobiales bacterium]
MKKNSLRIFILVGLFVSLFLAIFISPFASPYPDGLERVAEDKGFLEKSEVFQAGKHAPIPDYAVPGLAEEKVATAMAGLVGTVAVFLVGYGLAFVIKKR